MERYSPHMAQAIRCTLAQASLAQLADLLTYYRRRGGPGLAMAAARHILNQAADLQNLSFR